jgi:hypothetical protein
MNHFFFMLRSDSVNFYLIAFSYSFSSSACIMDRGWAMFKALMPIFSFLFGISISLPSCTLLVYRL